MSQPAAHMQIGEVAERTDLSLRTIRYYGEVGLVVPSARSRGGFRLYTEADVGRLLLVKRMKLLEFSVEDMGELLSLLDRLAEGAEAEAEHAALLHRLAGFESVVEERRAALRRRLSVAEEFGGLLRDQRRPFETQPASEETERR
ncbi:DNA-binding transcriptional MerR regulator [Nocardiopsis mwathae]|uniref:DNA-binding transcriptional MerR regulator n=1 Tax=Nocardiopsis mwathae TaxID=1472723 RepID=A0A7X0D980_9ACTN|nr:MerR family transcriptional regulator [Nocardiopsis mwathae]MBB6174784.1 DNA-binding transcriptional MerR regulator [Nocardiopsis mwathae]